MEMADRLSDRGERLTTAERRIAEVVLDRPQLVAFGTVAEVASTAGVGTATVVRLAAKLGYDGFADLQDSVQRDLVGRLRPAAERIREQDPASEDLVGRHAELEAANVSTTIGAVGPAELAAVVGRLSSQQHDVLVMSGSASRGVATQFVDDLSQLRPNVRLLDGNEVDVQRTIALATDPSVVAIDLRRYDRWLVDSLAAVRALGCWTAVLTDGVLSPLAEGADHCFVLAARSAGPFDSHVGTLALLDLFVVEVAATRKGAATRRLDRLERRWSDSGALTDG